MKKFFSKTPYIKFSIFATLAWLFCIIFISAISYFRLNVSKDDAYGWISEIEISKPANFNELFSQWDGEWYIDIAKNGYIFKENELSNVAFFPLYPFLLRFFYNFDSYVLTGIFINLFFISGSIAALLKLMNLEKFTKKESRLAILFLLIFPTSFFLLAIYPESTFLFLSIMCFLMIKKDKPLLAGIFGLLASLTRVQGILLLVPLLLKFYKNKFDKRYLLASLIALLGIISFFMIEHLSTGNIKAFFIAESFCGRNILSINPQTVFTATSSGLINTLLDVFFIIYVLLWTIYSWSKVDSLYTYYSLSSLILPISTGSIQSIGRFSLMIFPLFMMITKSQNKLFIELHKFFSFFLLIFYLTLWVNGYWSG